MSAKKILGSDLKVGDLIKTWNNDTVRVERIDDYRKQFVGNQTYRAATAYCTGGYEITVFLDARDIRLA